MTTRSAALPAAPAGEPGAAAAAAIVLVLMTPALVPQVARWIRTFPAPGATGPSSDPVWWTVLAASVAAIAISVSGRKPPRWMTGILSPRLHPGRVTVIVRRRA